LLFIACHKLNK